MTTPEKLLEMAAEHARGTLSVIYPPVSHKNGLPEQLISLCFAHAVRAEKGVTVLEMRFGNGSKAANALDVCAVLGDVLMPLESKRVDSNAALHDFAADAARLCEPARQRSILERINPTAGVKTLRAAVLAELWVSAAGSRPFSRARDWAAELAAKGGVITACADFEGKALSGLDGYTMYAPVHVLTYNCGPDRPADQLWYVLATRDFDVAGLGTAEGGFLAPLRNA
ncbi:MAG: hypothetical protein K8I27_06775 [Planctomycetes bacterium]|nr:hypothetical protein [Planctomycetota bacterium]